MRPELRRTRANNRKALEVARVCVIDKIAPRISTGKLNEQNEEGFDECRRCSLLRLTESSLLSLGLTFDYAVCSQFLPIALVHHRS